MDIKTSYSVPWNMKYRNILYTRMFLHWIPYFIRFRIFWSTAVHNSVLYTYWFLRAIVFMFICSLAQIEPKIWLLVLIWHQHPLELKICVIFLTFTDTYFKNKLDWTIKHTDAGWRFVFWYRGFLTLFVHTLSVPFTTLWLELNLRFFT